MPFYLLYKADKRNYMEEFVCKLKRFRHNIILRVSRSYLDCKSKINYYKVLTLFLCHNRSLHWSYLKIWLIPLVRIFPAVCLKLFLFVVVWQAAQISRASPAWQSYIKYVSGVVMEGLKTSTHTSLRSMLNQIVFSNMSQVSIFSGLYIWCWVFVSDCLVVTEKMEKGKAVFGASAIC